MTVGSAAGSAREHGNSALTVPQRHLLEALAWWAAMGHDAPTRTQLAAKVGWTPKGSNLRNRLSELSQAGLVDYPKTGHVRLTPAGESAAPVPNVSETLIESIRAVLTGPQCSIFDVLLEYTGQPLPRAAIAEKIGWEPAGSNLRNRLSELSQLELVEYPARGEVQLQEWVR
jgi:Mn-dependent DtxR family transcriptional regulator